MADLEEKILKKNIPGKYSTWSEYQDNEGRSRNHDDSDEEDYGDGSYNDNHGTGIDADDVHQSKDNYHSVPAANRRSTSSSTGVKGVLSDHRQAKQFENLKIAQEAQERKDAFRNATSAATLRPGEQSISIASMQKIRRRQEDEQHSDDDSGDSEDDSFLDDDDDFLQSYRQTRLSQMQSMQTEKASHPTYGTVTEIKSLLQFSTLIDETPPKVFCIFHLYNSSYPICRMMNEIWEKLAKERMDYARFFRMEANLVKENFDPLGFPCVLVYCDGKEVANLTPITKQLEGGLNAASRFTMEDIEGVLASCGIRHP
jgi:hypothetical protein